jgi:hypothetical protein
VERCIGAASGAEVVPPGQLNVHADNGSSMISNPVVELLTFLGVACRSDGTTVLPEAWDRVAPMLTGRV